MPPQPLLTEPQAPLGHVPGVQQEPLLHTCPCPQLLLQLIVPPQLSLTEEPQELLGQVRGVQQEPLLHTCPCPQASLQSSVPPHPSSTVSQRPPPGQVVSGEQQESLKHTSPLGHALVQSMVPPHPSSRLLPHETKSAHVFGVQPQVLSIKHGPSAQSSSLPQAWPSLQGGQVEPPQSTSLSVPSCKAFVHEGGVTQAPLSSV